MQHKKTMSKVASALAGVAAVAGGIMIAHSRVGNPLIPATKHGGDSRHCCIDINGSGH